LFTLAYLLAQLHPGATPPQGADGVTIAQGCVDSRLAQQDSLFVALPGERTDGHLYVSAAMARGATVALVQRPIEGVLTLDLAHPEGWLATVGAPLALQMPDPLAALQRLAQGYRRDQRQLRVVGVTGSVGKTTAKEVIAAVLAQRHPVLKSEGNANNEVGLPLTLLLLQPQHRLAVLEMGMYALGEITLLCDIARPQVGVVMNVGPVHLERLGSIERIAQAKAELVRALPADGLAVLNGDDPRVRAMAALTQAPALTFGLGADSDLRALDVEPLGLEGVAFRARVRSLPALGIAAGEATLRVGLLGRHAVLPALAATAVGLAEGLTWEEIARGLEDTGPGLRLAPQRLAGDVLLLDDSYNASPASSEAALDLLASLDGRRVAVLGDMLELGEYEERGHREVGQRCAETVALLITVGRRARWMAQAAVEAGLRPAAVHQVVDCPQALALLRDILTPGDVLLIKGSRGMAMEALVQALVEKG
jgi:UDP-N-acetylmuramoyl-tripeptide--D-alanyl-D-alanine ligase